MGKRGYRLSVPGGTRRVSLRRIPESVSSRNNRFERKRRRVGVWLARVSVEQESGGEEMTDFNDALDNAQHDVEMAMAAYPKDRRMKMLMLYLDAMAAAHADVVAERDSYRDVAHKLARYVLPDSDTLTIRQLVDAADAVCEAAEEGDDVD